MATDKEHAEKARSNERFLNEIRSLQDYADWGVTVVFYIAVQWSRALLAYLGIQITSHKHFQSQYVRVTHDSEGYNHFRSLQTASEKSRYDATKFTWPDVDKLISSHLEPLKTRLKKQGLRT